MLLFSAGHRSVETVSSAIRTSSWPLRGRKDGWMEGWMGGWKRSKIRWASKRAREQESKQLTQPTARVWWRAMGIDIPLKVWRKQHQPCLLATGYWLGTTSSPVQSNIRHEGDGAASQSPDITPHPLAGKCGEQASALMRQASRNGGEFGDFAG